MTVFSIEGGGDGMGTVSYAGGLMNFPDGTSRGVEDIVRLTVRARGGVEDPDGATGSAEGLPALIGTLRGALPRAGQLPMPMRLAVSTVRAGLGVIEEGFSPHGAPHGVEPAVVEIVFRGGETILARMPAELVSTLRRDRNVALGALDRVDEQGRTGTVPAAVPVDAEPAESLTSIFRYEKRNGRLRRIPDDGRSPKE